VSTETDETLVSRRRFLTRISLTLGAVAGAVLSIPIVAYLLSPLLNPAPRVWRTLGGVNTYRIGETVSVEYEDPSPLPWAGQTALTALWLRRISEDSFVAFALNCSHLGCPVDWKETAQLFLCPCHGGVYYADGTVAAGPPPLPLAQYRVRTVDGIVQILTQPVEFGAHGPHPPEKPRP
jgi:menaquinol-cytochrome c reductase iron-sulfur subunit